MSEEEKFVVSAQVSMSEDQCNALLRFNETCEDGQEYDVRRSMMKSLTYVGMVRWCGGSRFEITDAGIAAVEDLQERAK
jgi:hypothetical protein